VKRLLAALVLAATALVLVVPPPAAVVERTFSTGIYPSWVRAALPLTDAASFAVFDVVLSTVCVGLLFAVVRRFRKPAAMVLVRVWRAVLAIAVGASLVYLWFLAAWGLNYHRLPLKQRLGYDRARISASAARALAERIVGELNRLHPAAWSRGWPELEDVPQRLAVSREGTAAALRLPAGIQGGRPKTSMLQPYFRWAGIDGVTNPFIPEMVVNQDALPMERLFIVAHEWGHLMGLAHEAEASYAGWRLCLGADEQAQYSAWLALFGPVIDGLPRDLRSATIARLDEGPRRDLRAIAERYRQTVPAVREVAWSAYDRYLRSNRVAEGVASYQGVVDLILGISPAASEAH
jgi:hypothetical protein